MPAVGPTPPEWPSIESEPTRPDPLPADGLRALDLLDGERLLDAWSTRRGFLVLTNLRCLVLVRHSVVFRPDEWLLGTVFHFFNLGEPRVVHARFIELSEEYYPDVASRFDVADPESVRAAISEARQKGREEWDGRRQVRLRPARFELPAWLPQTPPVTLGSNADRVPCPRCGELVRGDAERCPSCRTPVPNSTGTSTR